MRTAQEDADTGNTTAGSIVITTKRGSNEWHGGGAFYDRAAALNARIPDRKSRAQSQAAVLTQNYVGTLGGPIAHDRIWFFSSYEYVHEDASIAYSPQPHAVRCAGTIASDGLIPGVPSITVPANVPIPFRDYLGSLRFDWAQSEKSHGSCEPRKTVT